MYKFKKKLFLVLFTLLFIPIAFINAGFDYVPMEKIPFFGENGGSVDFCNYIDFVYKFGIAAVSIAALIMLVIGGFMYSTSAGNNAAMENAKRVLFDALIGLLLALAGWLILYTINPELTFCKLPKPRAGAPTIPGEKPPTPPAPPGEFAECDRKAREEIERTGTVKVKSNICQMRLQENCTTVCELPQKAIDGSHKIATLCGMSLMMTGGTEGGHASHGPGKPAIDLKPNPGNVNTLADCIFRNKEQLGIAKICVHQNQSSYSYNCGTYREPYEIVHVYFN